MKKKYFIYAFLIMILVVMLSGCGVDTSTLAGKASQVTSEIKTTAEDTEEVTKEQEEHVAEEEEAAKKESEQEQLEAEAAKQDEQMVWIPNSGKKYHSKSSCSNMKNPTQVPLSKAEGLGYEPCKKCY